MADIYETCSKYPTLYTKGKPRLEVFEQDHLHSTSEND